MGEEEEEEGAEGEEEQQGGRVGVSPSRGRRGAPEGVTVKGAVT